MPYATTTLEADVATRASDDGFLLVKLTPRPDGPEEACYALLDLEVDRPTMADLSFGRLSTLQDVDDDIAALASPTPQVGDPRV